MGAIIAAGDLVDGKYRIIRMIGEGGWGVVFEGENIRTFKRVAIKILRPHSGLSKDILTRFEREAQAAGRIGSDHIVEVYDLGSLGDGTHYMVMELLSGEELSARLRAAGALDAVMVARIVLQLLDGLKAAHDAGIQHRDLKPDNLFLVRTRGGDDFVKILDFGISKFNDGPQGNATMTGAVLGSPCYMAPEQARGLKQIDARTDLYAVGTLMFESLTGRVPFEGDNFNDLMFKIVLAPRPDPRELRPDLDGDMAAIVSKAMAIDPKQRFQSADELSTALLEWLASKGVPSVRAPEWKRAGTTPRTTSRTPEVRRAVTPPEKSTERDPLAGQPWDATMPANSLETPLVSSATGVRAPASAAGARKNRIAVVAVVAALTALAAVAAALVVVSGARLGHGRNPTPSAAAVTDPPAPVVTPSAVVATSLPSAAPLASVAPVYPPPAVSLEPAAAPAEAAAASPTPVRSTATGRPVPASRAAAAGPSPAAKASDVPPATTPAPSPVASPSKPVGTVEGREIRTGL